MGTTDKDYADKSWLASEPKPAAVAIMDCVYALGAALGLAIFITVALHLQ